MGAAWVGVLWVEGQGASLEEDLEVGQVGDQVGVLVEAYEASVLSGPLVYLVVLGMGAHLRVITEDNINGEIRAGSIRLMQ